MGGVLATSASLQPDRIAAVRTTAESASRNWRSPSGSLSPAFSSARLTCVPRQRSTNDR
jgi:hypothetical protein